MSRSEPPYGDAPRPSAALRLVADEPLPGERVPWVRACWEGESAHGDGWSSHSNPYPRDEPGPPVARLYAGWVLGWLMAYERQLSRTRGCGCVRDHK